MSQPTQTSPAAASLAAPLATSLRHHAEQSFAEELAVLARLDDRPRPPSTGRCGSVWRPTCAPL